MAKSGHDLKFLTQTELKSLLARAREQDIRAYTMILLAYRHGLRASEVCKILISDIDLAAGEIVCRREKGSITNWQHLAADETEAVRVWLQQRPKTDSPFLFVSRQSPAVSRSQFFRVFQALARTSGVPAEKCHPHSLKHSLGTHLAYAGLPAHVIQRRMGHESVKNTIVYLNIADRYVDEQCELARQRGEMV